MLELYDAVDERNLRDSDAICTALQLINFWQDVAIDLPKGRIYLPLEDLERHGVSEAELASGPSTPAWRALMRFEVERARSLMLGGSPLVHRLPGRIGSCTAIIFGPSVNWPGVRGASEIPSTRVTPGTWVGNGLTSGGPAAARSHVGSASTSTPSSVTEPPSTSYPGRPMITRSR